MKRASEVLPPTKNGEEFSDAQLSTTCPDCGKEQTLAKMSAKEESGTTGYFCGACNGLIVVVHPFKEGEPPQEDSGYRLGGWVLSIKADLFVRVNKGAAAQFPATPAFFDLV